MFYEVGANVGFYAVIGARLVGPSGHICAFEPFPRSAQATRDNLRRNGFTNATVVQSAASDQEGTLLLVTEGGPVDYRLVTSAIDQGSTGRNSVEVAVVTIDGFREREGARPPDLVMIDVEGSEIDVIRGMEQTIRAHRPAILCEVHWLGAPFLKLLEEMRVRHGYRASLLDGRPLPNDCSRYHALLVPEGRIF